MLGSEDGQTYADRAQVRGQMILFRTGRLLFDVPAPIVAQKSSPRFLRISKALLATGGLDEEETFAMVHKFEQSMIT